MNLRIGYGIDVHRLEKGLPLIIGGVKIESTHGAVGHSDADVLLHAICDAILGAANLRDIGFHFSDQDPKYKNIDSKLLLKDTYQLIKQKGFKINNIDATIIAEKPKLNPHIPAINLNTRYICTTKNLKLSTRTYIINEKEISYIYGIRIWGIGHFHTPDTHTKEQIEERPVLFMVINLVRLRHLVRQQEWVKL